MELLLCDRRNGRELRCANGADEEPAVGEREAADGQPIFEAGILKTWLRFECRRKKTVEYRFPFRASAKSAEVR